MRNKKRDHCWPPLTENSPPKKYSTWSITQRGYKASEGGGL